PAFRHRALAHVHDQVLTGFWQWYDQLSDATRAQATAPLMNKLCGFLLRPFVRQAIAAGPSTLNMTGVLDGGGILLARLAKDALGTDTARLVGSIIVAHAWQATTARARQPQTARRDAALYIDECHNFLNLPYPIPATPHHPPTKPPPPHPPPPPSPSPPPPKTTPPPPRPPKPPPPPTPPNKGPPPPPPEPPPPLARHTHPRLTEHDLANLGRFH